MKIVVLAGGTSTERAISCVSGKGYLHSAQTERTSGDSCGYFLRH